MIKVKPNLDLGPIIKMVGVAALVSLIIVLIFVALRALPNFETIVEVRQPSTRKILPSYSSYHFAAGIDNGCTAPMILPDCRFKVGLGA